MNKVYLRILIEILFKKILILYKDRLKVKSILLI